MHACMHVCMYLTMKPSSCLVNDLRSIASNLDVTLLYGHASMSEYCYLELTLL